MGDKKVILITGASRGIGRHLAEHYAQKGFHAIGCSRGKGELTHDNYRHFSLDVADPVAAKRLFSEIRKDYGSLDVLINNAGVLSANYALLTPVETAKKILDTNFMGTFIFCCEAAKIMQKNRHGRIVNISTIAVQLCSPGTSVYGASKAAVEQFARVFSAEVAPYGITVNNLSLSFVKNSGMIDELGEETVKRTVGTAGVKRLLDAEEVAQAVDDLLSEKNDKMTGQTIHLGYAV